VRLFGILWFFDNFQTEYASSFPLLPEPLEHDKTTNYAYSRHNMRFSGDKLWLMRASGTGGEVKNGARSELELAQR